MGQLEDCRARLASIELLWGSSPRDALLLSRALLDDDLRALAATLPEGRSSGEAPEAARRWLEQVSETGKVSTEGLVLLRRAVSELARASGAEVTGLAALWQAIRRITRAQAAVAAAVALAIGVGAYEVRAAGQRRAADFETFLVQGNAQLTAGRRQEAVELFRKALATMPDTPRSAAAWNDLGWSLHELGRYEEADAALRKALLLQPVFPLARNNLEANQRKLDLRKAAPPR